ncbi:hypothetical protein ES332_A07G090400v1 [Gossypium tomentosum]|uniref:Uncharacterized protein n=1 Tax=Gossypium tomentosum TaxID=34277 RepID=A0A5D2PR00_GOSTO|nr:hypothetical protein ES332_A07G090400v1 [Gossypium tomentosum]
MRSSSNSTATVVKATGAGFQHWNPALFGGVAVVLGLIVVAIVIIVCSYKKSPSNSSGEEDKAKQGGQQMEMASRIVVIMAGDQNPTYLANPMPSTSSHHLH